MYVYFLFQNAHNRYALVQSLLQHYTLYAEVNLCGGTNDCPTFVTFTCHLVIAFLDEQVCIGS